MVNYGGSPAHIVLVALIALTWVVGCGGSKATPEEITGEWLIAKASYNNLPESLPRTMPLLDMKADGTFVAVNLPIGRIDSTSSPTAIDGHGSWRLLEDSGG